MKALEIEQIQAVSVPPTETVPPAAPRDRANSALPSADPVASTHNPDDAWIETARCPSCNEFQLINDRMSKYNDNKQAYIGDIDAGTFRQLVEAAEACQVSIIHPGKPATRTSQGSPSSSAAPSRFSRGRHVKHARPVARGSRQLQEAA